MGNTLVLSPHCAKSSEICMERVVPLKAINITLKSVAVSICVTCKVRCQNLRKKKGNVVTKIRFSKLHE